MTGKTQPRLELLKNIADYLDVDIRDLFHSTKATDRTGSEKIQEIKKLLDDLEKDIKH